MLIALVVAIMRPSRMPVLRGQALGADGTALGAGPSRAQSLVLFAAVAALAITAPLAGHATSHSPRGLLAASDTVHVLCMCTWLGGLVMLVLALPFATRALEPAERTPLLATVVGRFSRLAMLSVTLLLLSGIVNSVVLVASFDALVDTTYGRLVLAKIALFVVLIGLGAFNQKNAAATARADRPRRPARPRCDDAASSSFTRGRLRHDRARRHVRAGRHPTPGHRLSSSALAAAGRPAAEHAASQRL